MSRKLEYIKHLNLELDIKSWKVQNKLSTFLLSLLLF